MSSQHRTELELDGKIYLVDFDGEGNEVERVQLDGDLCMKTLVAVLENTFQNPLLNSLFEQSNADAPTHDENVDTPEE